MATQFYMILDAATPAICLTPRFSADTLAHAQTLAQSIATLLGRNSLLACLDQGGETSSTLGSVVHVTGTGGTVTVSGTPVATVSTLEFDITTGGSVGTALFSWKLNGVVQQNQQVTSSSFLLTNQTTNVSTGITVDFGAGTYVTNDVYTVLANLPVLQPWTKYTAAAQGTTVSCPATIAF
jgi:hypothetical protein